MFSNQTYFPIATIDVDNQLRLVEYNQGVELMNKEVVEGPLKALFDVKNLKGPIDLFQLEALLQTKLSALFGCVAVCDISNQSYDQESAQLSFNFSRCTHSQLIQALFSLDNLQALSCNGKDDWIPLDTQSVINMYPDYCNTSLTRISSADEPREGDNSLFQATKDLRTLGSLSDRKTNFDWRLAHLEEAFNSFSSNNQVKFNIRKEGTIIISVVREWLVSQKLQEFMHSLFAFTHVIATKSPQDNKLLFWYVAQFKNIFDGFKQAKSIYTGLVKYGEHFAEVHSNHAAQMKAHLEALELHIDVILDPSLEPNTQTLKERLVELSELLSLCCKTMMEFTVALQTRLDSISKSKSSAHKKFIGNAVIAAVGVGVALYTRPTRLISRAAHFASILGSCGLAYFFYALERDLALLMEEQERASAISSRVTTTLRGQATAWSSSEATSSGSAEPDHIFQLSHVHLVELKGTLKGIQAMLDQIPPPKVKKPHLTNWW